MITLSFVIMIVALSGIGILLAAIMTVALDRLFKIKEEPHPILDMCLDCGLHYENCECHIGD